MPETPDPTGPDERDALIQTIHRVVYTHLHLVDALRALLPDAPTTDERSTT